MKTLENFNALTIDELIGIKGGRVQETPPCFPPIIPDGKPWPKERKIVILVIL